MHESIRKEMQTALLGKTEQMPQCIRKEFEELAEHDIAAIERIFDDAMRQHAQMIFETGAAVVLGFILNIAEQEPNDIFMRAQKIMVATITRRLMTWGMRLQIFFDDDGHPELGVGKK